jgi:hypothetical protein
LLAQPAADDLEALLGLDAPMTLRSRSSASRVTTPQVVATDQRPTSTRCRKYPRASCTLLAGIEVGIIGREGMTGLSVVMGTDRSPHETFMQVGGDGQRMSSVNLCQAVGESPALHRHLLRYGHAFVVQTAQTVLANGRNKIEQRLARWLLMASDRLDGDEVPLTHEFLSVMHGVRRPGVTTTLDRKGLRKMTNGSYGAPEAEFKRLFG